MEAGGGNRPLITSLGIKITAPLISQLTKPPRKNQRGMRCIPRAQERTQRIRVQRKVHRGWCFVDKRAFGASLKFSEMESERAHHTATGHQIILPVTEFAFGHRVATIAQIGSVYTQF